MENVARSLSRRRTLVVFIAVLVLSLPSFARAAATTVKVPCGVAGADLLTYAGTGQLVVTNFVDGSAIVVCHGTVPAPGTTVHLDARVLPVQCGVGRGGSYDWRETITPQGDATLVCRLPEGAF
jgi:hypothetical protein